MVFLSILKKVTAEAAAVTENGLPLNEKINSFRNTKFGTNYFFDKDVQDAFFKDQQPIGAPLGSP